MAPLSASRLVLLQIDYNESFAPTFRPATLCIIMALAANEDRTEEGGSES